ncbi:hypothetical protein ACFQ60_36120 [Streptomyces zhihengii]
MSGIRYVVTSATPTVDSAAPAAHHHSRLARIRRTPSSSSGNAR